MNELRQQKDNIVLIIGKIIELDFRIFVFNTYKISNITIIYSFYLYFSDLNQRS